MDALNAINHTLPEGYKFRRLLIKDHTEVKQTLQVLTTVGEISLERYTELLEFWNNANLPFTQENSEQDMKKTQPAKMFNPIVIVNEEDKVVATGMLLVEPKIIHECGFVGHIEDIAICSSEQGKKFGLKLIKYLYTLAQSIGCYKVILDCDPKNVGFYEKCGMHVAGTEMEIRFT
ncbi:hypothetical protein ACO0QE_003041 [Hanseniaspora vineae]